MQKHNFCLFELVVELGQNCSFLLMPPALLLPPLLLLVVLHLDHQEFTSTTFVFINGASSRSS
jgi:hypothetical protein